MSTRLFLRNATYALLVAIGTGGCIPDFSNLGSGGMDFEFDKCHKDDECPANHVCVGYFLACSPAKVCTSQTDCANDEICTSRLGIFSGEITRTTCEPDPNGRPDGGHGSSESDGAGGGGHGQDDMENHGGQGGAAEQGGAGGTGGQGGVEQTGAGGQGGMG